MDKLSTDEYTWQIQTTGAGAFITLRQTSTGKTKEFFMAGCGVEALSAIENHLNSLTDDLCSQWFNERVKKGKAAK